MLQNLFINRDLSPTKNLRTMIKGPRPQKLSIQGPIYNPGKSIKEEKKKRFGYPTISYLFFLNEFLHIDS